VAEKLYTREILRLATMLREDEELTAPHGKAELRSALCGSKIKLAVELDSSGIVKAVSMTANACAAGQASAAILQKHAAGLDAETASHRRRALASFLSGDAQMPQHWPELIHLEPTRDYPARHGAILLPYDALLAALSDASAANIENTDAA